MLELDQVGVWRRDLELVSNFLATRGLPVSSRLEQLSDFLSSCESLSAIPRREFEYGPEYLVYCHEYLDFFAERVRSSLDIDTNTLRRIFAGALNFEREALSGDDSRNLLLQIKAASYLANAGFKTRLTERSDVIAIGARNTYLVECKRIYSFAKCATNIRKAARQIENAYAEATPNSKNKINNRLHGIVWIDLSPMLLNPYSVVPVLNETEARSHNLSLLRGVVSPIANALEGAEFPATRFIVAQGSSHFSNLTTKELQYRVATYIKPTRHCGWLEGQRFKKATSYMQGFERGPHLRTSSRQK